MALGKRFDFAMHRGDQRCITFRVVDQETPAGALDITGVALEWNISKKQTDAVAPLGAVLLNPSKTIGAGITVTDAINGLGEVLLLSVDTVGRRPADYYHELQITAAGVPTTILYGVISLSKDLIVPGP